MNLKLIHTKNLRWIDIINPGQPELNYLKSHFDLHPLDYQDIVAASQHAKIEDRGDYQMLVLLFPVFDKVSREIRPGEVDFFVGKDYLITIHDGSMYTMINLVNSISKHDNLRAQYMGKNAGFLLFQILESLFRRSYPILDHINKDTNEIEKNIFKDLSVRMLKDIALIKRNIIDFRRIMKTHHLILKKLMNKKNSYVAFTGSKEYYASLLEHAENIWDILAMEKETAESLQDANQALATHTLNQITKVITIFSGIFLPSTIIMLAFGLSIEYMPLRTNPDAFPIIISLAVLASLGMTLYFKSKKWF